MYKPTYIIGEKYVNTVIQTTEMLHGFAIGSDQSYDAELEKKAVKWLDWRVNSAWDASCNLEPEQIMYDDFVRGMARAALALWRKRNC